MQTGIIHWASMADTQLMWTNHLSYKAISKRQSETPWPFPTRAELKWVNCVPTAFSKSCFARTNHRYSKNTCICYSSSDRTARFEMLWGYVLHNNKSYIEEDKPDSQSFWPSGHVSILNLFKVLSDMCISPFFPLLQLIPHCCKFFSSSLTSYLVTHPLHFSNCFTGFQPQSPHGSNITQQKPIH